MRAVTVALVVGFLQHTAFAQPGGPQPPPQQPQQPVYNPGQPVQLVTPEERELLIRGEISPDLAIAGGLVGTFFGLGIGHAVQGRYSDIGWVFTVGELGGAAVVMVSILQCFDDLGCDEPPALFWGGVLAAAGFRIWELVDVWLGPQAHNTKVRELRYRLGYPQRPTWGMYLAPAKGASSGKVMGLSLAF